MTPPASSSLTSSNFGRTLGRISAKSWARLKASWLEHVPEIDPPGCRPQDRLADIPLLQDEAKQVAETGEHRFVPEVHPAPLLFHSSVFAAHRAVRVSCAAWQQVIDGLPTWSLATAHQASMLALQSLLGFCGITYLEIAGRHFLLDVFPAARKGRRRRLAIRASADDVQLMATPRMEQRHWWLVLQRLLRTSGNAFSCWHSFDPLLSDCDEAVLSRHRNGLLYRGAWYFDDLFDRQSLTSFGLVDTGEGVELVDKLSDPNGSDGSLILNRVLLFNSIAMLRDLGDSSRRVELEVRVIDETLQRFAAATTLVDPQAPDLQRSCTRCSKSISEILTRMRATSAPCPLPEFVLCLSSSTRRT